MTDSLTFRFFLLSKLKLVAPSGLLPPVSPHFTLLFWVSSRSVSGTVAMHRIQPGVSCSPAGPCENMNVSFDECQVVTFRGGLGFVTLSCHLHLVEIFWPTYSYAETHLFP